jgi:hypothetical protein
MAERCVWETTAALWIGTITSSILNKRMISVQGQSDATWDMSIFWAQLQLRSLSCGGVCICTLGRAKTRISSLLISNLALFFNFRPRSIWKRRHSIKKFLISSAAAWWYQSQPAGRTTERACVFECALIAIFLCPICDWSAPQFHYPTGPGLI